MRYLRIVTILCLFLTQPLLAAETRGLYEAEVAVPEQSTAARTAGMREAMASVLVKVSGSSRISDDSGLAEALQSPGRYVQQYRYRSVAMTPNQAAGSADGQSGAEQLLLQVSFDPKSIDTLLRSHGFSVWGEARPSTLIWLGVEDKGSRVLVGANDGGLLRGLIEQEAERRALPVKLPMLDLTDQRKVRTADVWGDFLDTIKEASQRYDAQAIMVGRLYRVSGNRWEARWSLDYRNEVVRWQSNSDQAAELITEAIDRVTDHLAMKFAQSFASGGGDMLLRVEDVRNLKDYRRVLDYLKGVHGVKQVIAETMTANAVRFHLMTSAGRDAILQVVALGNTLERVAQPEPLPLPSQVSPTVAPLPLPPGAASQEVQSGMAMTSGDRDASAPVDNPAAAGVETAVATAPLQPELVYRLLP